METPKDGNRDHSLKTLKMKLDAVMPPSATTAAAAVANPDAVNPGTGIPGTVINGTDIPQGTQNLPSGDQQQPAVPTQHEQHTAAVEGPDVDDKAKEER